jgi:hypothetical protein
MKWRHIALAFLSFPAILFAEGVPAVGACWEKSDNRYALYVDGALMENVKATPAGEHLLVYQQASNASYLLENFYALSEGKIYPAQLLSVKETSFWYKANDQFLVFDKGERVEHIQAVNAGQHVMAYDTVQKVTYVLIDFMLLGEKQVHPAVYFGRNYPALWYKKAGTFRLFESGLGLTEITYLQTANDLLVFCTTTNTTYLLPSFIAAKDGTFPAEILSRNYHVFWRRTEDSFWIYDNGATIIGLQSHYEGEDLICIEPISGKTYVLTKFNLHNDNELRMAIVR